MLKDKKPISPDFIKSFMRYDLALPKGVSKTKSGKTYNFFSNFEEASSK